MDLRCARTLEHFHNTDTLIMSTIVVTSVVRIRTCLRRAVSEFTRLK